ncbi:hypothetical protein GCK72_026168 [Caenorhabditis remanei]|uniref:Uncharacterized protein n=1 Tax=Caenorhabditis remanei TaxID=31234 RepID=A0A6A5G440_CAERE|nr:hypothetical protein GCK72_026168 [Caenorhabditis remanei]KAF1749700.1 hypothetical protein GCK72_026168 [Caenorhabditis remanei]
MFHGFDESEDCPRFAGSRVATGRCSDFTSSTMAAPILANHPQKFFILSVFRLARRGRISGVCTIGFPFFAFFVDFSLAFWFVQSGISSGNVTFLATRGRAATSETGGNISHITRYRVQSQDFKKREPSPRLAGETRGESRQQF